MASLLYLDSCVIHGEAKHRRKENGTCSRCTKCEIENLTEFRRARKQALIDAAGGKCVRCGYSKTTAALEFHHRVPSEKVFELSLAGMTKSAELIAIEVVKCDLVCRNCHAEIHEEMRS